MLATLIRDLLPRRNRPLQSDPQMGADVAVVVQTVLRPSVERAIRSVLTQDFSGRIHLLVGVDKRVGSGQFIEAALRECPANVVVTVFDPGYSTSARHGGVHSNFFGGSLRTLLSFAANSRYVAYLDDDDWFGEDHLSSLLSVIQGKQWAFSRRWFVNPYDLDPMCVDTIENLGPDAGIYAPFGGFACPSSLMVDKLACASILHLWSEAGRPQGDAEDRVFFRALCETQKGYGSTGKATVYCVIKPEDGSHELRKRIIAESGYPVERLAVQGDHEYGRI